MGSGTNAAPFSNSPSKAIRLDNIGEYAFGQIKRLRLIKPIALVEVRSHGGDNGDFQYGDGGNGEE